MQTLLAPPDQSPRRLATTVPDLDEVIGEYRLRFSRNGEDVEACQRLRFRVFNLELHEGLAESFADGLDRDVFDEQCDHLMVEEARTGEVIGTYRLQTSEAADRGRGFYTAGEFELGAVPSSLLEQSVELGRACIEQGHRNRRVLFLLWRGLAAYGRWNDSRWMLGCSSLSSTNPGEGNRCYEWLRRVGHLHRDIQVPVKPAHCCEPIPFPAFAGDFELPPLFDAYLRHGAKVCSAPALDREFRTIDFLTLIDVEDARPRFYATLVAGLPF